MKVLIGGIRETVSSRPTQNMVGKKSSRPRYGSDSYQDAAANNHSDEADALHIITRESVLCLGDFRLNLPVESLKTQTSSWTSPHMKRFLTFYFALICSSLATANQEVEGAKFESTFNRSTTPLRMAMNEDRLAIGHYLTRNPFRGGPF